jgi:hypothetical protein
LEELKSYKKGEILVEAGALSFLALKLLAIETWCGQGYHKPQE